MPNPQDDLERDPETPQQRRTRELYERYRRRFNEEAPTFGVPQDDIEALMVEALKTGRKILENIPPDCEA